MPAVVQRAPLADQAASVLLARVREGEWGLGHRIPGETTLARELGVGRSTVREAVRQLAGRGILEPRQGSGVYVVSTDANDDWDVVVRRADLSTVLEARVAIESEAAALAAGRRTPAQLRMMRRRLDERLRPELTADERIDADIAFHRSVVVASGNELLLELFDGFTPRVRASLVELLRGRASWPDGDADAHAAIVDAVAARAPVEARAHSREHLQSLVSAVG